MSRKIDLATLLEGCADTSFDNGVRINTELEPLSGPGGLVKPAIYAGAVAKTPPTYQEDCRWASPDDDEPTPVIVIDNVPSQANRLEDALRRHRESIGIPEFVLDLSELGQLPAHLPREISSLHFPHRNADAYLLDAMKDNEDFNKSDIGPGILNATAANCGPLVAWFPQALLYGFWQSHLGTKQAHPKHARAWVSEIIGWKPAITDTKIRGTKGDPLNLNIDGQIQFDKTNRMTWKVDKGKNNKDDKHKPGKLSEIGHGQVLFGGESPAAVSFARVTQQSTISFAQLRHISLGTEQPEADQAVRALLVALGLHAHQLAFGHGFALRSGAELQPRKADATWLGAEADEPCLIGDAEATLELLQAARKHAGTQDVPLDGWGEQIKLKPNDKLASIIRATWPE